jgi:hypothetical protein
MSLLTTSQDAQLAQDVVTTVLEGALSRHGSQKLFAASAGISPVHLNYIIKQKRMPSRKMAEWMAQFLPMPPAEREMWVNYVHAYWQARDAFRHELKPGIDLPHFAAQVQQARQKAEAASDPTTARINNENAYVLSTQALSHAVPEWDPLLYLQLMESFLDASALLGRRLDALWMARRLQWMSSELEPLVRRDQLVQLNLFRLSGMRNEAVVLGSIGLRTQALVLLEKINTHIGSSEVASAWRLNVIRDRIDARVFNPNTSLRETRSVWHEGLDFLSKNVFDQPNLEHFRLTRSFSEAALMRGRLNEATELLLPIEAQIEKGIFFPLRYRVLFDCTLAKVLWHQPARDVQRWQAVVKRNHAAATQAGYTDFVWDMHQDYGEALQVALAA